MKECASPIDDKRICDWTPFHSEGSIWSYCHIRPSDCRQPHFHAESPEEYAVLYMALTGADDALICPDQEWQADGHRLILVTGAGLDLTTKLFCPFGEAASAPCSTLRDSRRYAWAKPEDGVYCWPSIWVHDDADIWRYELFKGNDGPVEIRSGAVIEWQVRRWDDTAGCAKNEDCPGVEPQIRFSERSGDIDCGCDDPGWTELALAIADPSPRRRTPAEILVDIGAIADVSEFGKPAR